MNTDEGNKNPAALVLSGGGARGAYEVGVIKGIVRVLKKAESAPPPFRRFAGSSVGAINAAFLAANTQRGDLNIDKLEELWLKLSLQDHLRINPLGIFGKPRREEFGRLAKEVGLEFQQLGGSLVDPDPLDTLVRAEINWNDLHRNVEAGLTEALIVTALEVASGQTTMFAELNKSVTMTSSSNDPRKRLELSRVSHDHVMASAAIPMFFPARLIGKKFYCDGGLRLRTPISPAIRCGATKLCLISLMHSPQHPVQPVREPDHTGDYPHFLFLLGKVLNALLLDPLNYDLHVLDRTNRLFGLLEESLPKETFKQVERVLGETRGASYRKIDALIFAPSEDIGRIASSYLRDHLSSIKMGWLSRWAFRKTAYTDAEEAADLASYLLFDSGFSRQLIDLGLKDALNKEEEIIRFFSTPELVN